MSSETVSKANTCGYYLRAKRRKGNNEQEFEDSKEVGRNSYPQKWKCPIMRMPTEIIQNILKYLSYTDLSERVRLVNHRFKLISENILDGYFKNLPKRLEHLKFIVNEVLYQSVDDTEVRYHCKLLNTLEFLEFYYSIVNVTIWRHIDPNKSPSSRLCMYAGQILDVYRHIVAKITRDPLNFCSADKTRNYKPPQDIEDLSITVKAFCNHFEAKLEQPVNDVSISGCKIIDILDCANMCLKTISLEGITGYYYQLKAHYFFSNSWFVALDFPEAKATPWQERQKYMYMRLRRLVVAHTEMCMIQEQYWREKMLLAHATLLIPKPACSVYTGYGENSNKFFFYGAMNDGAYHKRFFYENEDANDGISDEEDQQQEEDYELNAHEGSETTVYNVPKLGLQILVNVKCPINLAPYVFLKSHGSKKRRLTGGPFYMHLHFICPGACYPRLPEEYHHIIKLTK